MYSNSITIGSLTLCCRGPHEGFTISTSGEEYVLSTQQTLELLDFLSDHRACLLQTNDFPGPGTHWIPGPYTQSRSDGS
ncbi:hypothetical protein EPA93_37920 [Ktedonosporobacter rubrisoli]|uniref:Uncharacterized protein n=1 Tax=Ktedonosporobacter rubrisoli TaxID=2509675 RepID=A0A4P6K085_KTERU|nr:hypothetical protein [Ktedonosporobacter rubrisoli]QBD81444.1 hypothetical protein EPA93_37920 [Ktedonosporobacter rubrisoli]